MLGKRKCENHEAKLGIRIARVAGHAIKSQKRTALEAFMGEKIVVNE